MGQTRLEGALRRDRIIVLMALATLVALAWIYIWLGAGMDVRGPAPAFPDHAGAGAMGAMAGGGPGYAHSLEPGFAPWSTAEFFAMLLMWCVMMVGMMTPSAAPMILMYARVARHAEAGGKTFAATGWFASGYLLAWAGYAAIATSLQWLLVRAMLLTPMMASSSPRFGGLLLILAGLFQWTPLKDTCLAQCQSPLLFIQRHGGFRADRSGALALGLRHGAYCIGCCWALMLLLFLGGVMNVVWIAAIAVFVLAEKAFRFRLISRISGVALVAAGVALEAGYF
jgi:predicted metal-binding membrane protein